MTSREFKFRIWCSKRRIWLTTTELAESDYTNNLLYLNTENPSTHIMQYIGIKDSNDKEIYEGDIIKIEDTDWVFIVKYMELYNCGCCSEDSGIGFNLYRKKSKEITVIGNIYEHEHLLTKYKEYIR